jgi:cell division protein FtsW (lipid II flippase)
MRKYNDLSHAAVAISSMLCMMWFAWMKLGWFYVLMPFVLGVLCLLSWQEEKLEL